ncbi:TAXI family TRAP transporter solute-binding subunit [Zavarzinia sp.]|uniref:TAXI family TRAP transporter solute-binding subunit n=1 Tax=Zavarzinia sp. TaxID=2027920 RepID=UPI003BB6FBD5
MAAVLALGLGPARAEESRYFSIATAEEAGTYFPVGQALVAAVSAPPGLVVSAVSSNGSIANVETITGGGAKSGPVQADVRLILSAADLSERDFAAEYYKADLAARH